VQILNICRYSPIIWDKTSIDILIKRYKEGMISKFLELVEIGAEILCRGPYGNFSHRRERQDFLLILSIGTGIAPMLSIIRYIASDYNFVCYFYFLGV
jgi:ferredoxin-NADP reductase